MEIRMENIFNPTTMSIMGSLIGVWAFSLVTLINMFTTRGVTPIKLSIYTTLFGAASVGLIMLVSRAIMA